jgi:hypothetical protein
LVKDVNTQSVCSALLSISFDFKKSKLTVCVSVESGLVNTNSVYNKYMNTYPNMGKPD